MFELSHGTINYTVISPREVFIRLCLCGATNFILAHNHPSGDTIPSTADIELTQRIKEAGQLMNINLLDHVILGDSSFSFKRDSDIFTN